MHTRHLSGLRLLVATAVAVSAVSAFAVTASAGPISRADAVSQTVNWSLRTPAPFAGTRFDGEYVPSLRRVFFLGFRTLGDATDGSVWYFDVPTNTYVDTGVDLPVPVSNYGISQLRDATGLGLYIFGGRDAAAQIVDTVQVYYPLTNTATTVPTDPWPGRTAPSGCVSLPAMGVATSQNRAHVLGGLAFLANGCADEQSRQTWVFNPQAPAGSRWSAGPNLRVARGYITTAVLGSRLYAIGGDTNSAGTLIPSMTVEVRNLPSGAWSDVAAADLPVACDEAQAFGFGGGPLAGGVVLAGCGQWPNAIPDTHFYDQATNSWSVVGAFNENRRNHAGALVRLGGGRQIMYILGGYGEVSGFIDPIFSQENGEGAPAGTPARAGSTSGASGGVPTS